MPVLVPDKVTDFIIDVTGDLFSGRVFSSFGVFFADIGDFFLTGGTDRDNRKLLNRYRNRIEQYLERSRRNLLFIAAHPDVRRSLPDYGGAFASLYAKAMLQKMVRECFDIDIMAVYTAQGGLIAEVKREGETLKLSLADVKKLSGIVRKRRGALIHFSPTGRIVLASSFSSKFREKYGVLVMVLNQKGIRSHLSDLKMRSDFFFFFSDRTGHFFVGSGKSSPFGVVFKKELQNGTRSVILLQEERFVTVAKQTRRTYLLPLRTDQKETCIWIGLLGPEGSIVSFVLLMMRMLFLVGIILLLLFLGRKIFALIRQIFRDRELSRKLLKVSLEKSLNAGNRVEAAAQKAVDTARMASDAVERGAGIIREGNRQRPPVQKSQLVPPSCPVSTKKIADLPSVTQKKTVSKLDSASGSDDSLSLDPEGYSPSRSEDS